ncbi:NAC domain-containing protein 83 [Impatiens glandulifera]|uniref:NAC domain-containing protein 83 n=1 Tax=Impatiens glandulifera TaxID=253017 RepID=UPI001FB08EEE|nr:NAC domain-containing protein 83 [Impatiens glandulifera]
MERLNFVRNGVLKLPPGFRFYPTDEELVVQYLTRKTFLCPLPASIIPEVDVCKSDPWDLPGELDKERYFFSTKEAKYPNGNRSNRATNSGYWKATGIDKRVLTSKGNQLVGMKKTLVFYRGKPPNGSRTDWIMHEYRLVDAHSHEPVATKIQPSENPVASSMENWVLCRIFLKKRGGGGGGHEKTMIMKENIKMGKNNPVFYDFMAKEEERADLNLAPASSSSDSSGITTDDHHHHEESSSCDAFSPFKRKRKN